MIPLLRAYVRYAPFTFGKRWLWQRVINPHFAWNRHRFTCRSRFAGRFSGQTRDILQQYLYYFGVWEPNLTHWILNRLRPGDTFVDVGANIGYYSLLASKRVGCTGSVVAIEASPGIFRQLEGNLRLNEIGNVRAINIAVSDREGFARLFRGPETNGGLSTIVADEAATNDCRFECEVAAAPLYKLLTADEIRAVRLIKIDVEGAEWPVVSGMAPLFSSARADLEIIAEVSPQRLARQGRSLDELLAVFHDAGFHAYSIENDYTAASYLARGAIRPPQRLRAPIEHEVDLIFSRTDAEVLA
jgi:FkbM family methyltransferase